MEDSLSQLPLKVGKDLWRIRFPLFLLAGYFSGTLCLLGEICPLRIVTGFPCPGCGLTRAGLLVLIGHWSDAARMNLTIFLWIPFLIFLFFARYLFPRLKNYTVPVLIVVCMITFVYYAIRMALVFPAEPVTYQSRNLLSLFMRSFQF